MAVEQRNRELERTPAEMEPKGSTVSVTPRVARSVTFAVPLQENVVLPRKLAELERGRPPPFTRSASVAIQRRNQELEQKLAQLERGQCPGSSPGLSSASAAIHNRNQVLERKLEQLEKKKSACGRVMSSATVTMVHKNKELERKFAEMEIERKTAGLSTPRQQKVNARSIQLKKLISQSQELDLAFLVDVTGGMQPFINSVKEKAPSIAAGVKKGWPQLKLRVAFAPYRDYEDADLDDAEVCDFTDDFTGADSVFVQALSRVCADGGEDEAEDVFSGLERVASLGWKSRTRVLVHIGDAPCHGAQFHDLHGGELHDRYPGGDAKGRDISSLLQTLRDQCQIIGYLFCHVNDSTKKMISVFKRECDDANWIKEEQLCNIGKLADVVVKVSASSISQSIQVGDSRHVIRKYVTLPVTPTEPLWQNIALERATQIKYKLPESLDDLFHALATNGPLEMEEMPDLLVQIAQNPFSDEGNLRWPYAAIVHQQPRPPSKPMVVKRFKTTFGEDVNQIHAKEAYFEQMEVQTVAAKLAEEFNKQLDGLPCAEYKTVKFTLVSTLRVESRFYNMERFLEGKWTRYSNNLNYVNTKEYAATLQAFSHWTYHRSNGLLMVNDLQGVEVMGKSGFKEFWLCDPSIHCKDALRYERTRTNWSEVGMRLFLEAHQCNNICRVLHLPATTPAFIFPAFPGAT